MRAKGTIDGYSLIEFIVIIAVGSLLVGGLVIFVRSEVESGIKAKDYLTALNMAKAQMGVMNACAIGGVKWGNQYFSDPDLPGFIGQQQVTAIRANASPPVTLYQIDEKVGYGPSGGPLDASNQLVVLSTYRESTTTFGDGI